MGIKKVLEKNGFNVEKVGGGWIISQFTPAGEDWFIELNRLEKIKEFCENFDPEEEFEMWILARGKVSGVPSPSKLWEDQMWKKNLLEEILLELT